MKVLLLHPPNTSIYSKEVRATKQKGVPLGILYIARVALDYGCETKVIDAEAENLEIDECVNEILKWSPDLLGITVTTPMINVAKEIAEKVKIVNKDIVTCVGGPHVSALPLETLRNYLYFDCAISGEGENTFAKLCWGMQNKGKSKYICGLWYRGGANYILGEENKDLIDNLDEINYPARNLINTDLYTTNRLGSKEVYTQITSSRGCPMKCIFCGSCTTFGKKARFRSIQNVIGEIKECIEKYNIRNFVFNDDTFLLNKKRVIEFCDKIEESKLDIHFFCSSHCKTIDEEMARRLKKIGCYAITFGIESGNNDILKNIGKGIKIDDARRALKLTKAAGIEVFASFMLGNLGETKETIRQTIDFAKELEPDMVQFSIAIPYPGTEFYNKVQDKVLTKDWSRYHWYDSVVYTPDGLTEKDLLDFQKIAYEEYKQIKKEAIGK